MKRIAFVGTVGAGKTTLFNALGGIIPSPEKHRLSSLMKTAISTPRENILAIRAGITP